MSPYIAECLGHFKFKTLLTSSSVFCEGQNFSVKDHPTGCTCGIGTSKRFFGDQKFCFLQRFFCHHASKTVSMSSAKVFFQEACAQYRTLAACQHENYPQGSWQVEGFRMQKKAAEQLATRSVCPTNGSCNHQECAGKSEDQASRRVLLQHVHLLLWEHQGIPYAHCRCPMHHQAERTWCTVKKGSIDGKQ